jgi:hypothetical protein
MIPEVPNPPALDHIVAQVESLAQNYRHDGDRLLVILRTLEHLHRKIRTELFEPALPNTRQELYTLLREIEEQGGWPYIERGKLQQLMQNIPQETVTTEDK